MLQHMAEAKRYEDGSEKECAVRLLHDMQSRFDLLRPSSDQIAAMHSLRVDGGDDDDDVYQARRRCSGLVLQAMGFIKNGC